MYGMAFAGALAVLTSLAGMTASAAELKALITNGMKPVVAELGPLFERTTGHKLTIRTEGSAFLQDEIVRGDAFDVAVLTSDATTAVGKAGKIDPATRVNLATSGLGVVVRAGAPKPDISTPDAFKHAMLEARSIAYATRGVSGLHFIAVAERLGIADQVKAKGKTRPSGMAVEFVAKGEAEIAVQQMSELVSVPGVDVVGPFPAELQLMTPFVAAVSVNSSVPEAAKAFLKFFTTPDAIKIIKSKGMEPD